MRQGSLEDALSTCHASLHKHRLRNICLDSWLVRRARAAVMMGERTRRRRGDRQDRIFCDIYLDFRYNAKFVQSSFFKQMYYIYSTTVICHHISSIDRNVASLFPHFLCFFPFLLFYVMRVKNGNNSHT